MEEVWKDIKGYEGHYMVSDLGRVMSLKRGGFKILKGFLRQDGYEQFIFRLDGVMKCYRTHQLVAMAFLNHTPSGMELVVDHINHIRTDNNLKNLRIITCRENTSKSHVKSASKYVGVKRNHNKWSATIENKGERILIGTFKTEYKAHLAYQKALSEVLNNKTVEIVRAKFTSRFKGVSFVKDRGKFCSFVRINGKNVNVGYFKNELEAMNMVKKALPHTDFYDGIPSNFRKYLKTL